MRSYLLSAVICCLFGVGFSYLQFTHNRAVLQSAYEPAAAKIHAVYVIKKNCWYTIAEMENFVAEARAIVNLHDEGNRLVYLLWLQNDLINYTLLGLLVGPSIVFISSRGARLMKQAIA